MLLHLALLARTLKLRRNPTDPLFRSSSATWKRARQTSNVAESTFRVSLTARTHQIPRLLLAGRQAGTRPGRHRRRLLSRAPHSSSNLIRLPLGGFALLQHPLEGPCDALESSLEWGGGGGWLHKAKRMIMQSEDEKGRRYRLVFKEKCK